MPKGQWQPPESGDAPAEVKHILKVAYAQYRDKHPGENAATKMKGAKIAWGAVHNAGWSKNKQGKWVKKGAKEMAEEIVIDAFKAGEYPQGKFTGKELAEIQSTYDPKNYEAPILIGHLSDPSYKGKSAIPAFGWIGQVKVVGDHLKLVASQFSEELKQFIKDGFYKKVSAAFFQPEDPNNPTPGKWHLHHLAFLGGMPPAVKGLEQIAFAEYVLRAVGVEFAEVETSVEVNGEALEVAGEIGAKDTMDDVAECCATFMQKCEMALGSESDVAKAKERMNLAMSDLSMELRKCIDSHFAFIEKLEGIETPEGPEMSEKKKWFVKFTELITNKRKETEMDAKKEQELNERITQLEADKKAAETLVAEFKEKERVAAEAQARADAEKKEADLKAEVTAFCETASKEGRMTPAQREKDEPVMLTLIKSNHDAFVSFCEKYAAPTVPGGVANLGLIPGKEKPETKLDLAAKYVKAHPDEFKELTQDMAEARAMYLESRGDIKF